MHVGVYSAFQYHASCEARKPNYNCTFTVFNHNYGDSQWNLNDFKTETITMDQNLPTTTNKRDFLTQLKGYAVS